MVVGIREQSAASAHFLKAPGAVQFGVAPGKRHSLG
jgi:hypothetical protein